MRIVWHPFTRFFLIVTVFMALLQIMTWIVQKEANADVYIILQLLYVMQICIVLIC